MAKITVRVNKKTADVRIAVEDVAGPSCYDKTARLEAKYGGAVSDERTDEFYADVTETQSDREIER